MILMMILMMMILMMMMMRLILLYSHCDATHSTLTLQRRSWCIALGLPRVYIRTSIYGSNHWRRMGRRTLALP